MKTIPFAFLVGLASLAISSVSAEDRDMAQLQGQWLMVSGSADGQPMPEPFVRQMKRSCNGDETVTTMAGQLYFKAKIIIDASKRPKTIDYQMTAGFTAGKTQLGIYEVDGETFRSCFSRPGAERPSDFTSKPGDGYTLSIWKRERAAAPAQTEKVPGKSDSGSVNGSATVFSGRKSGLEVVWVEGGTFTMGGNDDVDDGGPKGSLDECPHLVTVRDFFIGKYEVTQADWVTVMGTNPAYFHEGGEYPVEQVSWDDVQEFIRKLNMKLSETYRLPTEEEWEFAARGGLKSKDYRYSGSNNPEEVAWYRDNSEGKPHPVGRLKPNELGIFDMSRNIWEWCSDLKTPYPCDITGKRFEARVLRGGTWANSADSVRVRDRNGRDSQMRLHTLDSAWRSLSEGFSAQP